MGDPKMQQKMQHGDERSQLQMAQQELHYDLEVKWVRRLM